MPPFAEAVLALPLVAILRGLEPRHAEAIGATLVDAGFRIIEVPLNSPDPFASIERLAARFGDRVLVGAGTVLDPADVARLRDAGGRIVVMPHADVAVVRRAKELGLACTPGCATLTEAFSALAAGADAIKMFPAEGLPPAIAKAWLAVLPRGTMLMPVGGITPERMRPYVEAGVGGFGLGSALFTSGLDPQAVGERAGRFVSAWREIAGGG